MATESIVKPFHINQQAFQAHLESEPPYSEMSDDQQYEHVPIAYLEPDLRDTFNGNLDITIIDFKELLGSLILHVRIEYLHPIFNTWRKCDGFAAVVIEKEKPGEFKGTTKILIADDLKTAAPATYSVAIQNAAKKIGKRFGSDLNRSSTPGDKDKPNKKETRTKKEDERWQHLIDDCTTIQELNDIIPKLPNTEKVQAGLNTALSKLKKSKK